MIPRITSALQFGLNVLENAFDKIEVPEDEREINCAGCLSYATPGAAFAVLLGSSDEEGEDEARSASAPEPILEPKVGVMLFGLTLNVKNCKSCV